jgi:hypothetical protein
MMVSRLAIQQEDLFCFRQVEMARIRRGLLVEKPTVKSGHGFLRIFTDEPLNLALDVWGAGLSV